MDNAKRNKVWPIVVASDRYGGTYSGAHWVAFNSWDVPGSALGGDTECSDFFEDPNQPVGKGNTPTEAVDDLIKQLDTEE